MEVRKIMATVFTILTSSVLGHLEIYVPSNHFIDIRKDL
ncbi:hypothetical protein E2C01_026035 [Portunus trituberculatus]|uniref:Uncharacterized protein n=1 Tax=Portunus trituberculatus TaxID=210409 RepID=A0A5B7EHK7_PORTR|nr:hypothetical protein [Portunus trituberculatus]